MSTLPTIRDRRSLLQEWIRRFVGYTSEVTWFGPTSVMRAWGASTAGLAEGVYLLWVALLKRTTLMASSGDALIQVATERGSPPLPLQAAKVLVIVRPESCNVTAVTLGPPDEIEVDDSSAFLVGDEIRIRNGDGSVSDVRTILAINLGTGPHGGNELEVAALAGAYLPGTDDVDVLFRVKIPKNTPIATSTGVRVELLDDLWTSDANPVLDGEGTFVGLADKGWCECTTKGTAGNIDPLAVTALVTPIRGVRAVFNPEPGTGGLDKEDDSDLKNRAMNRPTIANQETHIWIESLAREGNGDVLRALKVTSTTVSTMSAKVLHRNGGTFSTAALTALEAFMADRVRSFMSLHLENVTLTAIEVEARITLDPGATLEAIGKSASSTLAAYLDFRKWDWGVLVDEAALAAIVSTTDGVATLETSSFLPASDTLVAADSLPVLVRLSLEDIDSGATWNADLAVSF